MKNKTELQKQEDFRALLATYRDNIKDALPVTISVDRFISVVMANVAANEELLECTPHSFIGSVLACAQLGLMPDGVTNQVHLIATKAERTGIVECTIMPGYKGLILLGMRSGVVEKVEARPVFVGDAFDFEYGLHEKLMHKPCGTTGEIKNFYAIIHMKGGAKSFEVMTNAQVTEVRDQSDNYRNSIGKSRMIWDKYFADMGNKTVLRKLMKFTPLSAEITLAVELDEKAERGVQKLKYEVIATGNASEAEAEAIIIEKEGEKAADANEISEQEAANRLQTANKAQEATIAKLQENIKKGDRTKQSKRTSRSTAKK